MHLEGRDPCTAREEGKHSRKNGRSREAYEKTTRANEDGRSRRKRKREIHSSRGDWTVLEGGAADKSERE